MHKRLLIKQKKFGRILIASPETIHVKAVWASIGSGALASTYADSLLKNFNNAPQTNVYYPIALAEALSGQNLNGTKNEMTITVNSSYSNWYYGTDGATPAGKYSVQFDGSKLSSGVYYYSLKSRPKDGGQAGDYKAVKKLVLLK